MTPHKVLNGVLCPVCGSSGGNYVVGFFFSCLRVGCKNCCAPRSVSATQEKLPVLWWSVMTYTPDRPGLRWAVTSRSSVDRLRKVREWHGFRTVRVRPLPQGEYTTQLSNDPQPIGYLLARSKDGFLVVPGAPVDE